jgi:hypothetical protein
VNEDLFIAVGILFLTTGAIVWCIAFPGALILAVVRAVLRAVRRRRERAREDARFALTRAELNDVLVEQAAAQVVDGGLDRMYKAIGLPPDPFGEDR